MDHGLAEQAADRVTAQGADPVACKIRHVWLCVIALYSSFDVKICLCEQQNSGAKNMFASLLCAQEKWWFPTLRFRVRTAILRCDIQSEMWVRAAGRDK